MLKFIIILLAITLTCLITGTLGVVRVYEDVNFQGASRIIPPFKACLDFNSVWKDRISAVNTEGGCIILCEHQKCQGTCEKFFPGSPYHNDFTLLDLNDKVSSYRNCEGKNDNNIPS